MKGLDFLIWPFIIQGRLEVKFKVGNVDQNEVTQFSVNIIRHGKFNTENTLKGTYVFE